MESTNPTLKTQRLKATDIFPWQTGEKRPDATGLGFHNNLDDFEILRELGQGGMGTVYKARQASTDRFVALKILSRTTALNARARQRFQREIHALARINHPNVVPIYAAGEDEGCLFYAMELIEGDPLDVYVGRKKLDIPTILKLFTHVCRGVSDAHQAGIIHRDLKPSNILVDKDGHPKIVDLGLAKLIDEQGTPEQPFSLTASYVGTPAFMSPEQCGENGGNVDTRTDIYSLGVLLYLLILGVLPYPVPRDPLAAVNVIRRRAPTLPRKLEPSVPVDLEAVLMKALAKHPSLRYRSVDEFVDDLENILACRPVSARRPTRFYVTGKFVRRNWGKLAVAAAWILILVSVVAYAFIRIDHARREAVRERDAAFQARMGEAQARRAGAREAYYKTISLVSQRIAGGRWKEALDLLEATPESVRGWEWGRLKALARPEIASWRFDADIKSIHPLTGGETAVLLAGNNFHLVDRLGTIAGSWPVPENLVSYAVCPADGTVVWTGQGIETLSAFRFDQQAELSRLRRAVSEAFANLQFRGSPHLSFDQTGKFLTVALAPAVIVFSWPELEEVDRCPVRDASAVVPAAVVSQTGQLAWIEAGNVSTQLLVELVDQSRGKVMAVDDTCRILASRTDGRFVAVGTDRGGVFRDAKQGHYTPRITNGAAELLSFSPDGAWLASEVGGIVLLYPVVIPSPEAEAELGERALVLTDSAVTCLSFTSDSSLLMVGFADGQVKQFLVPPQQRHTHTIRQAVLATSQDQGCLLVDDSLVLQSLRGDGPRTCRLIRRNVPPVSQVAFADNGDRLAVVSLKTPVVEVYDASTLDCRCLVVPGNIPALLSRISADGRHCLVVDQRRHLSVYHADDGRFMGRWPEPTSDPYAVSDDGLLIVCGTDSSGIKLIDVESSEPWAVRGEFSVPGVLAACFSRDSALLALARQGDVLIVDVQTGETTGVIQPVKFSGHPEALAFCPQGNRLAVGEASGASLWNFISGHRMLSQLGPVGPVARVEFLADGCLLLGVDKGESQALAVGK